jgi:hypothetical protein
MARTIIAVFGSKHDADGAAHALRDARFPPDAVITGAPAETAGGELLTVTSDDGPLDRVMEILNRHHPHALEQHTQGSFDAGDAAIREYLPNFDLTQGIDESLGREDWATAEGKCVGNTHPDDCAGRRRTDPHSAI